MAAEPRVGLTFQQEYLKGGEAEDVGTVLRRGGSITVPADTYRDVLVTKDTTPLEPGVVEHKSFAPGVGFVFGDVVGGGRERTALVALTHA